EERHADFARMPEQLAVVVRAQLERLAMFAVGATEAELVVVRLVVELTRVQRTVRALLQLDRIGAALLRRVDQPFRGRDLALVVVPDLGDDVARAIVADLPAVDRECAAHRRSMLVAPARRRARSASTSICTSCVKPTSARQPSCVRA